MLGLGDFNVQVGKCAEGFEGIHGGYKIGGKNAEGRMLLDFFDQKELCVANAWYKKKDKRKVTHSLGGNDTEIDFVLVGKERRKYLRDGLWGIQRSKATGVCNEDSGESAGEQNRKIGDDR